MSNPARKPSALTPEPFDPEACRARARAAVDEQVAMLARLARVGVHLAEEIERRHVGRPGEAASEPDAGPAQTSELDTADPNSHDLADHRPDPQEPASPAPDPIPAFANAYSRISRAVRLTYALQNRLLKDLAALETSTELFSRERAKADRNSALDARDARRDRAMRILNRIIKAEHSDWESVRLSDSAFERLNDEESWGDLLARPMLEVVQIITRELGLEPDWDMLSQEPWAQAPAPTDLPAHPFLPDLGGRAPDQPLPILGRDRSRSDQGGASDYAAGTSNDLGVLENDSEPP